jgi:hypothetical protein
MNLKKTVAIAAAAGALAAISVPAMAFENEIHGAFNLKYYLSNYENGGGGRIDPTAGVNGNTTTNLQMNNYFEQRARVFYNAKANDDLKLVTAFEIDSVWGDKAQGGLTAANSSAFAPTTTAAFRNSGGAMEADAVNLETKWVYLDFKIPSTPVNVKAGIQAFKDQLKGIFLDADVAGVLTTSKLGNATLNVGYFRGYDQSYFSTGTPMGTPLVRGNQNLDMGAVEAKVAITKDINVGAVYYMYGDGRPFYVGAARQDTSTMLHTFGLTAEGKVGPLTLSGFGAYQFGVARNVDATGDSSYINALAYNLAAKAAVGPGTLKTALLFTSGNDYNATTSANNRHLTGWVGTSQSPDATWASTTGTSTYNEGGMMLLNRNSLNNNTTTDNALIYNTSNGTTPMNAQGMYLITAGYDANITPKLYTNANVGLAWTAHTNALKPFDRSGLVATRNQSNFMGAEVNLETGYKMYDNLTARVQAAYVILGGYYNNSVLKANSANATDPENPYTARVILSYAF